MDWKDIASIILGVVAVISFVIFFKSVQDSEQFVKAFWSCLITSISVAIVLVWNPWLVGKK